MNKNYPYTKVHWFIHQILIQLSFRPRFIWSGKYRVFGLHNIPAPPYIMVANHHSYDDPQVIEAALNCPLSFLAKKELYQNPTLGQRIALMSCIPVDRERPGASTIKQAKAAIEAKWPVAVFIEGTRNESTEHMLHLQLGAAFIAKMGGGLNALPIGLRRAKTIGAPQEVHIGEVIPFEENTSLEEMTLRYGRSIAALSNLKLKDDPSQPE